MKLQVALDFISIDDALRIAKKVAPYCDILEAGTPLIKSCGQDAIYQLKKNFPQKLIFADMKTADAAEIEIAMAAKAGADYISVLASSAEQTIRDAIKTAKINKCHAVFDLIGVKDKVQRAMELEKIGVEYIHIHTGLDEQKEGKYPLLELENISRSIKTSLTVAGGISLSNISDYLNIENVQIIMVGGAITKSTEPEIISQKMYQLTKHINK